MPNFKVNFRDKSFFATVYFVQGAMGLAALAKLFFLKDEIGLNEVQFAMLTALAMLPFTIKPIYGLISDFFPLFGKRRQHYLVIGSLLNICAWGYLATQANSFWEILFALTLSGLGLAIVDVIADGMVVERSTPETVGKLQSLCWTSLSIAALLTAITGGILLEHISPRQVFLLTALLPALTLIQALFLHDPSVSGKIIRAEKSGKSLHILLGVLGINAFLATIFFFAVRQISPETSSPEILTQSVTLAFLLGNIVTIFLVNKFIQKFPIKLFLGAVAFLFLWRSMPNISIFMQYFLVGELAWSQAFLGYLGFAGAAGNIIGAILFWKFFDHVPLRKLFFWTILIGAGANVLYLGVIRPLPIFEIFGIAQFSGLQVFALISEFIVGIITFIGFLPLFKLAAQITPKNVEATLFALVASFMNLGMLVSIYSGGVLGKTMHVGQGEFHNLFYLIIAAAATSLILIPLLKLVPKTKSVTT